MHKATNSTSSYDDFQEGIANISRSMYACPNVFIEGKLIKPDMQTPLWMRVPVNADFLDIETNFVEEIDTTVNPLNAKGLGEMGLVGIPPAKANAVFHATGKRKRELPLTVDKLLS